MTTKIFQHYLTPGTFQVDLDIINVYVTYVLDRSKCLEIVIEINFDS